MEALRRDLLHAVKSSLRSPVFATVFVLSLAIGIGAASSVFTLLDALLLRPLPVSHPEQLAGLSVVYRNHATVPISYVMFEEFQRRQTVFSSMAAVSLGSTETSVEINGHLVQADVRSVSGGFYETLGTHPLMGRMIEPRDVSGSQASQVAVISYEAWQERFAGARDAVGKPVTIEGKLFTVVGVTPRWFTGVTAGSPPEITVPTGALDATQLNKRSLLWLYAIGRLKQGVTLAQAHAQVESFWPELREATVPTESTGARRQSFLTMGFNLTSAATGLHSEVRDTTRQPLMLLLGIVAMILLVVCTNLASLVLARASNRRQEIGTRIALGATVWQAVRVFVAETMILAFLGATLAAALAFWGVRLLARLIAQSQTLPVHIDVTFDWHVFCFLATAAVITGLFTGLVPAVQLARQQNATRLREDDRTLARGTGRLGRGLIVSQIAFSLVLLQTAGLLLRSLQSLTGFDPGYDKTGLTEVQLRPVPNGMQGVNITSYRQQMLDAIAALPGVQSVSFSQLDLPAGTNGWKESVTRESSANANDAAAATLMAVTPGFFRTLGIRFAGGRDFSWSDDQWHPHVAIVDGLLARQLFPAGNAIGQRIRFGVQPMFQDLRIVGIAQSARILDVRDAAPVIYISAPQFGYDESGVVLVRGTTGVETGKAISSELSSFGHEYAPKITTLEEESRHALGTEYMAAKLSGFFAGVGLLAAACGLFGLMSYLVHQRRREIGIRMALGSQRRGILRLVLREGVLVTALGIAIGLPCALAMARMIAHMLFELSFADPVTLAGAAGAVLFTGAIAGLVPAIRAMFQDPMTVLRHE